MLSRAFTKPKRSPKHGDDVTRSASILHEYEDCIVGFMDDIPLVVCDAVKSYCPGARGEPTLREVLRASVGVMGESCLGITEKLVFLGGAVRALKRFRAVAVRKGEFGRRLQRMAQISRRCDHLVPVLAYLYSKRIKFVLCVYYPMGSLHDLLSGGRDCGHTALSWSQRLLILFTAAKAILFIHSLSPPKEKKMQMNVHGNIKSANIMINADFTACLSDYGFAQLARRVDVSDTGQAQGTPLPPTAVAESLYSDEMSQKGDIYNFGVVMLDIICKKKAAQEYRKCILRKKEKIVEGRIDFFDFSAEEKERSEAMQVLEIALQCTNEVAEERPPIEQVLTAISDVFERVI
ncbi:probable inactive receptor kinase At5g58300 [Rhodamnia argentea]|uniref:Probable inactive receptor kinase At5g58300 n=1 Tax=Rhodamnia argentea TaxID=178133 RepID=A0A8B8P6D4_9MYRT|nr:probable inactive receptor kinase At5g58300 [Rhodamnia argentea]